MVKIRNLLAIFPIALALLWSGGAVLASSTLEITVGDLDIPLHHYAGDDTDSPALLWLPSSRGIQPPMHSVASDLAALGISVWIPDLHMAYFVDVGRASLKAFKDQDIAALMQAIHARDGRELVVMGGYRSTRNVLGSIRAAQKSSHPMPVRGAILTSPQVFLPNPRPGSAAPLMPVVKQTNIPIYVIQPEVSTQRWRAENIYEALQLGGSQVFLHYFPETHAGFMMRPEDDLTRLDLENRADAPFFLSRAMSLLASLEKPATAVAGSEQAPRQKADGNRFGLKSLTGTPPTSLELNDLAGEAVSLEQFAGSITLVSFWASWCEPCIRELPSLQRFYQQYRHRNLEVVTVNVGETRERIDPVLKEFGMDQYAILFDPRGEEMKRWNVYGFPTNFVLGGDGAFRLGSFGAVEWDSDEVKALVEPLLAPETVSN